MSGNLSRSHRKIRDMAQNASSLEERISLTIELLADERDARISLGHKVSILEERIDTVSSNVEKISAIIASLDGDTLKNLEIILKGNEDFGVEPIIVKNLRLEKEIASLSGRVSILAWIMAAGLVSLFALQIVQIVGG